MKALRIPVKSEDLGPFTSDDMLGAEVPVKMPNGDTFILLVEVSLPTAWNGEAGAAVMIEIADEHDECAFFLRCTAGLTASAQIGGYLWNIQIGSGPWS